MIRYLLTCINLVAICTTTTLDSQAKDVIRDSVVKIHTTSRAPDYYRPWTKANPSKSSGSGVIIDVSAYADGFGEQGLMILTNAHVVRYASQIYIQPNQTTDKYLAKVVAIGPGIDLALLRVEDPDVLAENTPLPLAADLPQVKDTVNAYGFPLGGDDLSVTEGIVSRIEYSSFYFEAAGVRIQVDAALNPGNSGGPAVADGQIMGLVFSRISEADNIGYLIPAPEILAFLKDVEDGQYDGKPRLHDYFQSTENPALRSRVGLSKDQTGMVVTKPNSEDSEYPLKTWDVVTHVGPHAIDNLGMVQVRDDLRLQFAHFIPDLVNDGKVPLTILRAGEQLQIEVPVLNHRERLLPRLEYDYPEYAIYGPLVFVTLTQEYARAALSRKSGLTLMMYRESPMISRLMDSPAFPDEQLVIAANRMFPHTIKKGYGNPTLNVVTHLNEQPVKNLQHLVELLRDATGTYIEFTFAGVAETLVFNREEIIEANESILETEGIRYQFSSRLRRIWNDNASE